MSGQTKFLIITGIITIGLVVGAAFWFNASQPAGTGGKPVDSETLVGEDTFSVGDPGAKVTVVEFADFQCPACRAASPIVDQLLKDMGGQIYYVFRHYPLPFHANSLLAAQAVEAAGAQDKFREMHDKVFEGQPDWAEVDNDKALAVFQKYADELKLDREKFDDAIKNEKFLDKIKEGTTDGNKAGVTGTPTFYINGLKHEGSFSLDNLKKDINAALKK